MNSVIVYGGRGALGSAVVNLFKTKSWKVISIDLVDNAEADHNISVPSSLGLPAQGEHIKNELASILNGNKVDAVLCVAGGWQGGSASSPNFLTNAALSIDQSINTSLVAANLAATHLREGGLLSLTGAVPALGPTPGMVGYGMAKAAVHHLVSSLSGSSSFPGNVVGILPVTLDTPGNRSGMPDADFSSWTPLEVVADLLFKWTSGESPCESGKLYKIVTKNNKTNVE